jgi:hypothetical protein
VVVLAAGAVFAIARLHPAEGELLGPSATILQWAALALVVAFGVYAIEKELHLRRVSAQLESEGLLSTAYQNHQQQIAALATAARASGSVLG